MGCDVVVVPSTTLLSVTVVGATEGVISATVNTFGILHLDEAKAYNHRLTLKFFVDKIAA